MIRRMLLLGVLLVCAVPVGRADEDKPVDIKDATWEALDVEGKWILFDRGHGGSARSAWHDFLVKHEEHQLLEWGVLAHGWQGAGQRLFGVRSPHWMRCAIWALSASDSHSFEAAATKSLEMEPGLVLQYAERHPEVLRNRWLRDFVDKARAAGTAPVDAAHLLPPLTLAEVYAHLRAPDTLDVLVPGKRGLEQGQTRYVHQVERALETLRRSTLRDETIRRQLERLVGHAREDIRAKACQACAHLPVAEMPLDTLLYRASADTETPKVRRLAFLAFSTGGHPAMVGKVLEIASQLDHPGWSVAVTRLVDLQDPFLFALRKRLPGISKNSSAEAHLRAELDRLQAIEQQRKPKQQAARIPVLLLRSAWLEHAGHPLSDVYAGLVRDALLGTMGDPRVLKVVEQTARGWKPDESLLAAWRWHDPRRERVSRVDLIKTVRAQAAGLLK